MIIRNIIKDDINNALKIINKKYENNLYANFWEGGSYSYANVRYKFRLYWHDIDRHGSRNGIIGKIDKYACIHAHYDFFNAILKVNENAIIQLYEDWIIKKNKNNHIIGNLLKFNKYSIHKVKLSSFLCKCNKDTGK